MASGATVCVNCLYSSRFLQGGPRYAAVSAVHSFASGPAAQPVHTPPRAVHCIDNIEDSYIRCMCEWSKISEVAVAYSHRHRTQNKMTHHKYSDMRGRETMTGVVSKKRKTKQFTRFGVRTCFFSKLSLVSALSSASKSSTLF